MKLNWVDDVWFFAKHLWSVRWAAFGVFWAAAGGIWIALPADAKPTIPETLRWVLMGAGTVVAAMPGIVALMHQPKLAAAVRVRTGDTVTGVPPAARP